MWQGRARFELLRCGFGCPVDVRVSPHFRRVSLNAFKQINLSKGFGVSVWRFGATATVPVRTLLKSMRCVWQDRSSGAHTAKAVTGTGPVCTAAVRRGRTAGPLAGGPRLRLS